jgi:hypothetical protein
MRKVCERCGAAKPRPDAGPFEVGVFDYCAFCSKDLCDACMAKGCCGHTPAVSGMGEDHSDNEDLHE